MSRPAPGPPQFRAPGPNYAQNKHMNCGIFNHTTKACTKPKVICFGCGQVGHIKTMFPNASKGKPSGGSRPPMPVPWRSNNHGPGNGHGKAQGKSYGQLNYTNVEQVGAANNIVMGMLSILPLHGKVLFDS